MSWVWSPVYPWKAPQVVRPSNHFGSASCIPHGAMVTRPIRFVDDCAAPRTEGMQDEGHDLGW
eukprot:63019-Amphidinium_carterae.2